MPHWHLIAFFSLLTVFRYKQIFLSFMHQAIVSPLFAYVVSGMFMISKSSGL